MGLNNARKLKKNRKTFRDNKLPLKKKRLGITLKFDPLSRSSQARGIVTKKVQKEAKQPNSAMRKCCRVQLIRSGKEVTAFIPGNLAQKFIEEHDEVLIERIGGKQGRTKGDLSGVRFQIIKVNDQPLSRLWQGKIEKGRR
ncbi:MAG: 30S ribosomal protein S12 [Candidatus Nanoarchaeia archaeon]|jgi:small subunit ribosomal protein S12|nr:30S ribosomal protein S12 [Candidatus Nanoarchaeia archaeon]MDD3993596.1 30S ribosomal protein S12 [Candidatus Nanoarchaeia archaeon]MDD4563418.1 30S ribosomal protein S12 [Candidatus Nanoarchaeia archaeon]